MKHLRHALVLLVLLVGLPAHAQSSRDSLPYLKYPNLPAFNLLSPDSSKVFNTFYIKEGKPTVLFFFSPDCEHCQITTKRMLEKMDSMKQADFYFFTYMRLPFLRAFIEEYHLNKYPNIITGQDYQFFFPKFYGATTVPYLVVYDRQKKFVKLFNGGAKASELISLLNSL